MAILCAAVPFIFHVYHYRRRMKTLIAPDGPSGEAVVGTTLTPEVEYLTHCICPLRLPFAGNKHVKTRSLYHERTREIIHVIGRGGVTTTTYVNKIFKAHPGDNREATEQLPEKREAMASW